MPLNWPIWQYSVLILEQFHTTATDSIRQNFEVLSILLLNLQVNIMYSQAEKRVKLMDKVIAEWKTKADNISLELNNSQKDTRNASAELFRVKNG